MNKQIVEPLLDKRKTILYHSAAGELGGAVSSLFELIKNIDRDRFRPIVLITKNECKEFIKEIESLKVDVIYLDININGWIKFNPIRFNFLTLLSYKVLGRIIRHVLNGYKISVVIKRNDIDLIHTNDESLIDAALGAFFSRRKHVWHIRSKIGKDGLVSHFLGNRFVLSVIYMLSDKIIVNSKFTMTPWTKINFIKKVILIHNGVNVEKFSGGTGCLKKEFVLPQDSKLIVMITTSPEVDGVSYFVEAAGMVYQKFRDTYFFIVGKTDINGIGYIERQKSKIAELNLSDRFYFTGYRTDIPDILRDTAVIVEPMLNGSWSRVVLESMAAGVPVVGVEEDLISDFISNGVTGVLVNNQNQIGSALVELLSNEAKMKFISNNAKQLVSNKLASKIYVNNVMHEYEILLSK